MQWTEYEDWQKLQNSTELQDEFNNFQGTLEEYQSIGYKTLRELFDTHFVDDSPTEINYLPLPGYDGINYRVNRSFDSFVLTLEFEYINPDGVKDSYVRFFFFDPEGEIAHTSNSGPSRQTPPPVTTIVEDQGEGGFGPEKKEWTQVNHVNQSTVPASLSHIQDYKKLDETERNILYRLLDII